MGFLTRLLAGLTAAAALGAGLTGTANAVDVTGATGNTKSVVKLAADDTNNLPDHIVNGSFDYPSVPSWTGLAGSSSNKNNKGKRFATINPGTGKYGSGCAMSTTGRAIPNWNRSNFAWNSTQGDVHYPGMSCEVGNVELNYDSVHHNQFAELTADQQGTAIYQDVKVPPGTMMKWSLKHSSATSAYVDKMQVMIGEPYKETAQEATRIASENGNKVGEKMTTISTPTTSDRADNKKWDTYSGMYLVPDGVTTVRFTFKSVASAEWYSGNDLDDIEFSRSYKLTYDKNSSDAAGQVPSNQRGKENTVQPAKSKTNGTVKTVADENVRYGSLANGDFSYPSFSDIQKNEQETPADLRTFLKSDDGTLWYNMSATDLSKYGKIGQIPGFDSSRFAWSSTENGSRVELQQDRNTKNTYAEIVAQQDNTSIYQSVSTGNGGVLYKIRLKHASRQSSHADRMQVLVGSDTDHATPVEMTRVTSNGHGDKVGGKSTTITTKVSNTDPRDHGAQWETYEGYYQVPEGQKNTVFMFKSLEGFKEVETLPGNNVGNLVDDIEFSRSYKLTYDANSSDASGQVPSDTAANTVKQAKTRTTGTVRAVADRTASGLTVHDLETDDVPGDYRQFVLNTTDTRLSQVEFENGAWYRSTDSSSQGMWPLKLGASLTIPSVGEWTDPSGRTHQISMTMRLKDWNGGSVSELYRFDGHGNIVGDGRFWINTAYGSGYSSLPAKVEQAMGKVDTSKRVGCSWTVEFTYADTGEKVPDTFKGVTGFNDLDGWDAQSGLKFEGCSCLTVSMARTSVPTRNSARTVRTVSRASDMMRATRRI